MWWIAAVMWWRIIGLALHGARLIVWAAVSWSNWPQLAVSALYLRHHMEDNDRRNRADLARLRRDYPEYAVFIDRF